MDIFKSISYHHELPDLSESLYLVLTVIRYWSLISVSFDLCVLWLHTLVNVQFSFQGWATSNTENCLMFGQTLHFCCLFSSPHTLQRMFPLPVFLNHMLITSLIAAHSSAPPISIIRPTSPSTYCLPKIRLWKMLDHHTFTLKMATALFIETLNNSQHLTWSSPKARLVHWAPAATT
jgi:hypothetical protein